MTFGSFDGRNGLVERRIAPGVRVRHLVRARFTGRLGTWERADNGHEAARLTDGVPALLPVTQVAQVGERRRSRVMEHVEAIRTCVVP